MPLRLRLRLQPISRKETIMAKPIEATPTLYGDDAVRLLESLPNVAPPEEIARRRAIARERLAQETVSIPRPST